MGGHFCGAGSLPACEPAGSSVPQWPHHRAPTPTPFYLLCALPQEQLSQFSAIAEAAHRANAECKRTATSLSGSTSQKDDRIRELAQQLHDATRAKQELEEKMRAAEGKVSESERKAADAEGRAAETARRAEAKAVELEHKVADAEKAASELRTKVQFLEAEGTKQGLFKHIVKTPSKEDVAQHKALAELLAEVCGATCGDCNGQVDGRLGRGGGPGAEPCSHVHRPAHATCAELQMPATCVA